MHRHRRCDVMCNGSTGMSGRYIPDLLKSSIISPIPKVIPPQSIESDLRPISLTCNLAKIMEGFFCKRLLSQLTRKIVAASLLVRATLLRTRYYFLLQPVYDALDSGNACARFFFADFSTKGSTVLTTMFSCRSSWNWIFILFYLIGLTPSFPIENGNPECMVVYLRELNLVLFFLGLMTNKLISDWHLRTNFVDDTAALEMIPRNSISYLNKYGR